MRPWKYARQPPAGDYPYDCSVHPYMVGTMRVSRVEYEYNTRLLVLNNQSLLYIVLCTLGSCDAPRAVKVPV